MDANLPIVVEGSLEESKIPKSSLFSYFLLAVFFIGILVLGYFTFFSSPANDKIVAQVGKENLYQKDLNIEIAALPSQSNVPTKKIIEKMADDSVLLQAGAERGIVKLDASIFNSPTMDYSKRLSTIQKIADNIQSKTTHIQGQALTIFFQNGLVGSLGYAKSKEVALDKINALYASVRTGKTTIQQAINQVKLDASLKELDEAYVNNAGFSFDAEEGQPSSQIPQFDDALWQLPINTPSDIFSDTGRNVTKNPTGGTTKETYFIFGVVEHHEKNSDLKNYEAWLSDQKKKYEIIYK